MQYQSKLSLTAVLLAGLAGLTVPASAGTLVYVLNGDNQFGTIDVVTGAFQPVGPVIPGGTQGLAPGPNGSLLSLGFSGNLVAINPATGVATIIGATGLDDCATPASPCGPTSGSTLGSLGNGTYALDQANNFYSISPSTGYATLIGATDIPGLPFVPLSDNPDGTFNAYDETLFSAGGNLYATFDAFTVNPANDFALGILIPDELYRIDPATGHATGIGGIPVGIGGVALVNGAAYAFNNHTGEILTLNLSSGATIFAGNFDPAAGIIDTAFAGAAAPEPVSLVLSGIGLAAIALRRKLAMAARKLS